jgi:MFS family permease
MQIIGSLRVDGPATSAMLARRLGTDSGQTSHHLRLLARHGFVAEAPELGKGRHGRERWGKSATDSTHWTDNLDNLGPDGAEAIRALEQAAARVWDSLVDVYRDQVARGEWNPAWRDLIRLLALTGLAAAVWTGHASITVVIVVALIDAVGQTFFSTVEHAALRSIVTPAQLPTAVARNEARNFAASLAGPPLGGLLFGLAHALPFAGNALTYLASFVGVVLIRRPLQTPREEPPPGHVAALAEGVRFVLEKPFLRAVLIIAAPLNFALSGAIFTIIITLQQHGTEPAVIGLVETIIAVGGLAGAIVAPALQRRLRLAVLVRVICWAAVALVALSALSPRPSAPPSPSPSPSSWAPPATPLSSATKPPSHPTNYRDE